MKNPNPFKHRQPVDFNFQRWYNSKFRQSIAGHMSLGLFSFAITTFLISFVNADITLNPLLGTNATAGGAPSALVFVIIIGIVLGGTTQFVAGLLAFRAKNDRSAVVFCMFGAFWFSFGLLFIFQFNNLIDGSTLNPEDRVILNVSIGTLLLLFGFLTLIFTLAALWDLFSSFLVLAVVTITFFLLGIGSFIQNGLEPNQINGVNVAGGVFGILAAFIALYKGAAYLFEASAGRPILPLGKIILSRHVSPLDKEEIKENIKINSVAKVKEVTDDLKKLYDDKKIEDPYDDPDFEDNKNY